MSSSLDIGNELPRLSARGAVLMRVERARFEGADPDAPSDFGNRITASGTAETAHHLQERLRYIPFDPSFGPRVELPQSVPR